MDPNKMTLKTQEAIQAAQTKAVKYGHIEVEVEHLLAALLEQEGGLVPRLLERLEVPPKSFADALRRELERRPAVSGPGVEAGKIYLTERLQQLDGADEGDTHALGGDLLHRGTLLPGEAFVEGHRRREVMDGDGDVIEREFGHVGCGVGSRNRKASWGRMAARVRFRTLIGEWDG